MTSTQKKYLPYLSVFVASILWSSSFVALKIAFRNYDPMVVIFGRMLLGFLFMALFFRPFRNLKFKRSDLKYLAFMGLCEPCLYFIFEAIALQNTSASQAGMVTATLPLIVAVAAWYFLKEKLNLKIILGFIVAIGGVSLLSLGSQVTENAPDPIFGNLMELLAMVTATGYIITMKKLSSSYSALFITSFQALVGSVFYFPLLFLPSTAVPLEFNLPSFMAIVYLGVVVTFGAYGSYNYGVSKIPASQATAFINLIPVFSLILGAWILNDILSGIQYLAIILVFLGIFISQYRNKETITEKKPPAPNPPINVSNQ